MTKGLTKKYARRNVVDNVDICVRKGDIYGFVGKNGAGKTTLIRMLLGLTRPSGGSFSMLSGEDVLKARKKTGSLVESPALWTKMSARDNLRMLCSCLGEDKKQADEILEIVGLSDTGRKKAGNFSLGMKQRLGIGLALVGNPELLILDEPINGLDPTGIVEIRELLLRLRNERNMTIFISSHILGELEKIATRYGIIAHGKLVEEIDAEELAKHCISKTVLRTSSAEKTAQIVREILKTDKVETDSSGAVLISSDVPDIGVITNELFKNGITVSGITTDEKSAEDYFIKKMEEV